MKLYNTKFSLVFKELYRSGHHEYYMSPAHVSKNSCIYIRYVFGKIKTKNDEIGSKKTIAFRSSCLGIYLSSTLLAAEMDGFRCSCTFLIVRKLNNNLPKQRFEYLLNNILRESRLRRITNNWQ